MEQPTKTLKVSAYSLRSRGQAAVIAGMIGLAGSLLVASEFAGAHNFCATTAAELQSALDMASDGGPYNGEDNSVEVAKGTYKTGSATSNGPFYYASTSGHGLVIEGAEKANCLGFDFDPTTSVLDGNNATRVLELHGHGQITVDHLTIQNGKNNSVGAGLVVDFTFGDVGSVTVTDNIIQNNHTTQQNGGLVVETGAGGYLYMGANLIINNSADMGQGAGEVLGNGTNSIIVNNTVYGNSTTLSGGAGGLYYGGISTARLANNIFSGNSNVGLELGSSAGVSLEYNDYGTIAGVAPEQSIGNLSVSPQFVNAGGGDFHLKGTSPLLGISPVNGEGGYDLDGNFFSSTGPIDLGAYEETIFTDGFQGPPHL
jgi:hypothetical protein